MVQDGYKDIYNIDISPFVVESMAEKYKKYQELKCTRFCQYKYSEAPAAPAAASLVISPAAVAVAPSVPLNDCMQMREVSGCVEIHQQTAR